MAIDEIVMQTAACFDNSVDFALGMNAVILRVDRFMLLNKRDQNVEKLVFALGFTTVLVPVDFLLGCELFLFSAR